MQRASTRFTWPAVIAVVFLSANGDRGHANVVGGDAQNFNPVTGTTEFVTVHSTGTLRPGRFNVGLFLNQALNTLPYQENSRQSRRKTNDSLLTADVGIAVGLFPRVELGLAAPFLLSQTVKQDETRGEFAARGNTDMRAGFKIELIDAAAFGLATILSTNINRVQDNPYTGTSTAPVYNFELAATSGTDHILLGANFGYRWRKPGEKIEGALLDPLSSQAIMSLAAAFYLSDASAVVSEMFASNTLKKGANETNRSLNSNEFLIGLRHECNELLTAHIGAGTEVIHGLSTPDWRFYTGVVATFGASERRIKKTPTNRSVAEKKSWKKPTQEPSTAVIPTAEPDEVVVLNDINFEFDSDYRVMPGAFIELDRLARRLQTEPYKTVVVEGHTDSMGSDEYNDDLSFRRANTVRRYMIKSFNLEAEGIVAVGYGERYPLVNNFTDAGRLKNRRVEIKIFKH